MKKKLSAVIVIVVALIALIIGCKKETSQSVVSEKIELNQTVREEALNLIQNNLSEEYSLMAAKSHIEDMSIFTSIKNSFIDEGTAKEDFQAIISHRESLEDLHYANFNVLVDKKQSSMQLSGGLLVVRAAIIYKLPTNSFDSDTKEQIVSEGIDYYDFKLLKKEGRLFIKNKSKVNDFSASDSPIEGEDIVPKKSTITSSKLSSLAPTHTYNAQSAVNYALTYYISATTGIGAKY